MKFKILVWDNRNPSDAEQCYTLIFDEYTTAEQAARDIVDKSLHDAFKPGMNAEKLWTHYTKTGKDPQIVPQPEREAFDAWKYARHRCKLLTGEYQDGARPAATLPRMFATFATAGERS